MRGACLFLAAAMAAQGTNYYVTVAGLGGEPEYEQRFTAIAQEIDKLLKGSSGAPRIETLYGPQAVKARVAEVLAGVARTATAQDSLALMLVGHGTFDGVDYKFNLPGPDLSATELAAMLDRIRAPQLVAIMTSASGGAVPALKKEGRVLITATKSGTERNATVFARYWAEALRDPAADTDKNETITALEAYRFANEKTIRFYETQKRIATEHAQLEDTGKRDPVREPSPENGQGLLAARLTLVRLGAAQRAAATPEKRKLLEKKEDLEVRIAQLKYERAAMSTEEYRKRLTALLVELARTQAEIDK